MLEKIVIGLMAVVVILLFLLIIQMREVKAINQEIIETRKIALSATHEIEKLNRDRTLLQIQLDEASSFIAKLRLEITTQSIEQNQSEERW